MDNDLERSVRLLEDALNPSTGLGLFNLTTSQKKKEKALDLSLTLGPSELQKLIGDDEITGYNETMKLIFDANKTMTGSIIQSVAPWKNTLDSLYTEFFEVLQGYSGGHDILEVIGDLNRCCADAYNVVTGLKSKVATNRVEEETFLLNERNTWRLIFILYQDRLHTSGLMADDIMNTYTGFSEKMCVENLFKADNLVRESQLVIDWLESCACDTDDYILHFSDCTTGWENTLHQIKSSETIAFSSSRRIVSSMDPDAPHHENLPLHDLDIQDDRRLCQKVLRLIRCGKLEEAEEVCINCGHAWRASLLEGWRLFHNQNIDEDEGIELNDPKDSGIEGMTGKNEYQETEGNVSRGIWKLMALEYCKNDCLNLEEKAAVGAYCGSLDALLPVCNTWDDLLWAYMRTMVDIRVESEIRDNVDREYDPLPESYWDQRMSLNEIFKKLETSSNGNVKAESSTPEHIIQKYIILDEIPALMNFFEEWIEDTTISTHFLRFIAHIVLFLDQIGQGQNRDIIEAVIEAYIKRLIDMKDTKLVAYYISKINSTRQVQLYSGYLQNISDTEERKLSLEYAEDFGLNVFTITKQVVENIRNRPQEFEPQTNLMTKLTDSDLFKISALDWVIFYEEQRAEALHQSNAIIFTFLTLSKLDAAQLAFNKIPPDSVGKLLPDNTNQQLNQAIKEHLSYKAYLEAHESFNDWYQKFKSKPLPPEAVPESAQFTEKVAHQHRVSQYQAETDRWKLSTSHYAKTAKTLLYNVLLFPEGWLIGAKDADYLRSTCLPEIVLLLYTVLHESGMHEECVQLADLIASENYELYKVYSKVKLGEILVKLCESSLMLLNVQKNPWGGEAVV